MPTCSEDLSRFVCALKYDDLPVEVRAQAKKIILDGLGLILSGYGTEHGDIIHDGVKSGSSGSEATMLGYGTRTDCMNAAFANGVLAYTHDYSDTVLACVVHGEPVLVPTILAVGEREKVHGKSIITSAVAGYEVMTRIAMAVNSGANRMALHHMGFHPTGLCGVFGAAAAAGKLLGNSETQMVDSLGTAGSFASGILEPLTSTPITMARRLSGGQAAFSGTWSALLAARGFSGPRTIFEGENGFLRAFTNDRFDESYLRSMDDRRYFILDAAIKYRNCIHAAASPIDGLLEMVTEHGVRPDQIEEIKVWIPERHHQIFTAKKDMYRPSSLGDAQTSLPYCLAVACLEGEVSVDQFSEDKLKDDRILDLSRRVSLFQDEKMDAAFSEGKWAAKIDLTNDRGEVFSRIMEYPKGSPQNPLTLEELKIKFQNLSRNALTDKQQNEVVSLVNNLENLDDVSKLILAIHPPRF